LVESEGAALVLLIVADLGGLDRGRSLASIGSDLSGVDLELVGVECDGLGGLLDGKVDCYAALVGPWCVWLEVIEGDVVVGWLDTGEIVVLAMVLVVLSQETYSSDRISRSVAILTRLLEA
jgi:hypothetical protein